MDSSSRIVSSMFWKLMERGAAQVFSLVIQIILARLLAPDDFGILAILLVFVNISNVLIQKGFATALVQKKEVTDDDINTVLFFSELFSIIIYFLLWNTAPFIEEFYAMENLSLYIRVISISLFFGAFYSIENSIMVRKMSFKYMFVASFLATVIAGIFGVYLAYIGTGCWALIMQTVVQQLLLSLFSFPVCKWKIRIYYSKKIFKEIFGFGSKVLLSEILYTGVENIRTLLIGMRYSSQDLAFYDRGQIYPAVAMRSIYDTLGSVLLPIFSKKQEDLLNLKNNVQDALGITFFLIAPCFIGFAIISEPFTILLLTERWSPAIPYMQVFCIYQLGILPYCILRNVLYALGKSEKSLKLEILKSGLSLGAVLIGMLTNTFSIAVFSTVAVWISTFFYAVEVNKYLHFNIRSICKDFFRNVISCLLMSIVVLYVDRFINILIVRIIIDILTGIGTYILASMCLKSKYLSKSINIVKNI